MSPLSPKEEFALKEELGFDDNFEEMEKPLPGDSNYDGSYMNDDGDYESYDAGWYD